MAFDYSQETYKALREIVAERTDRIIAWTGSGLSAGAGLLTWLALRKRIEEALKNKIKSLDEEGANKLVPAVTAATSQANMWQAFQQIKILLGETTWRATIREALRPTATTHVPEIYNLLWRLRVHGILNLNLDRLATRAFAQTIGSKSLAEFDGKAAGNYAHVLKSPSHFVCNLHGQLDDHTSWVLTKPELDTLFKNQAYCNFINSCLTTKTFVFLGVSVEDSAVGGFFKALTQIGVDFGAHYWITNRRDLEVDKWAENNSIRVIRYQAHARDHSDLLDCLKDLISYVPPEEAVEVTPAFVRSCAVSETRLPDCKELTKMDAEHIRQILNNAAKQILADRTPEAYQQYDDFAKEYDEAIYRAWYASVIPGDNILCGYKLKEVVADGAFGVVYSARDQSANQVAVKVLHEGIRKKPDLLYSFRRGVRSMEILYENDIEGMVAYREASEIPAFVVMDWVNGPSLTEAVNAGQISDWITILRVGGDIADIVRRGHLLPQHVLHRDLRPSNVMLKDFYAASSPEEWQVVVLDFDLSWHRGSFEKSVVHGSSMLGYLAPEQIQAIPGVSTRHAAVDSFGLGMILYFFISGRNPIPDEHLHKDWSKKLNEVVLQKPCKEWVSVNRRFVRLIENATRHHQKDRWDMAQIQGELQRMIDAILNPTSVGSAELVAEEIAARSESAENYVWSEDHFSATIETTPGVKLTIIGDESNQVIRIHLTWGTPGVRRREGVSKWIVPRMEAATQLLRKGGFEIDRSESHYAYIDIEGHLSVVRAIASIDQTVSAVDDTAKKLRFD